MPPTAKQGFWQRFRRCFRWCRIGLLSLVLFLLAGLTYLNRVGLPDFLKARLVAALRARGVHLEFTRMRLRWYHGLVAENVSLGRADDPVGPHLSLAEADLKLDRAALHKFRFQVNSLVLHDGRLVVPLVSPGEAPEQFAASNIMTELHLLPGDRWELDQFHALCLGARINLSGTLTNASAVRHWQFQRPPGQPPGMWQAQLRQIVKIARQMRFSLPPELLLNLRGDARAPSGITADLRFQARNGDTAWGEFEKLLLIAKLNRPSGSADQGECELKLQLDDVRTPWGRVKLSRFYILWAQTFTNPMPAGVKLDCEFSEVATRWGEIPQAHFLGNALPAAEDPGRLKTELSLDSGFFLSRWFQLRTNRFTAQLIHSTGSLLPLQADWQWAVERPKSSWGQARHFELNGHATRRETDSPPRTDGSRGGWAALEPYQIDWESRLDQVTLTNVTVDAVALAGQWRAPELALHKFHADLYGRQLDASAQIQVATRQARAQGRFDFDLRNVESLLTPYTRRWLGQYSWSAPPTVSAQARVVLPAWTNAHPDWRAEVLPTLQLEGEFQSAERAFRGVPVSSAQSHFRLSNFVWHLPDFVATRPEGRVEFAYTSDIQKRDFHFRLRGRMDPQALKPLFAQEQPGIFDLFQFHEPTRVEGEIWGQWRDQEKLGVVARVNATNFVFREVPVGELSAEVSFTNRFLTATEVLIRGGGPQVSAAGVGYDLATRTVFLTNAVSTVDPKLVIHAIGPQTEKVLSPYTFVTPPAAQVNGWIEVRHGKQSDLNFELSGGPCIYWKFNVLQIRRR